MSSPQLWVIAGPNGAGKSTLARRYLAGRIEIVNPDDIAQQIAPDRRDDPAVAGRAGRIAIERRRALLAAGQSFAFETTLTGHSERTFMAEARDRGFKVNLVFVGIRDVAQSDSRVIERVKRGGHDVQRSDLERRYGRSMANLPAAMQIAHRVLVLDNSEERRRLILSRENGRTKLVSRRLPQWAREAIPAELRRIKARGIEL